MSTSSIQEPKEHRAGFVNIIGNPNVGKSTLMNALVGEKLSIVTAKAQTTRHRIMGIVNGENYQIVYSDTPGILKPNYRLQENMMDFVDAAIGDADISFMSQISSRRLTRMSSTSRNSRDSNVRSSLSSTKSTSATSRKW